MASPKTLDPEVISAQMSRQSPGGLMQIMSKVRHLVMDHAPSFGVARDGIVNFVAGLGMLTDRTATSIYAPVVPLNQILLSNMYSGSWLPQKIVDLMTEDMTREWITPTWKDHDNDTAGAQKLADEADRLNLQGNVTEGTRWGRTFGGAIGIIGIKDQPLDQPLNLNTIGEGDFQFIDVADRWYCANMGDYIRVPLDGLKNFPASGSMLGYPRMYNRVDVIGGAEAVRVHWTRTVRFGGAPVDKMRWLMNARWDDSVLQAPFDAVRRFDVAHGGAGSLIWDAKTDVIGIENLKEQLSLPGGDAILRQRFDQMAMAKSLFNVLITDSKDKYERKTFSFSGIPEMLQRFTVEVAGASGYPVSLLFGQSPGGLNSTGDNERSTYYDKVHSKQEAMLRPSLRLLLEVLQRSAWGKPAPEFRFTFNPLEQASEKDKAGVELQRGQRDKLYVDMGAIAPSVITKTLRTNRTYPGLTDEDVAKVEAVENTPQPAAPAGGGNGGPGGGGGGGAAGEEEPEGGGTGGRDSIDDITLGDILQKEKAGWQVYSTNGKKHLGGPYKTKADAMERIAQVEFFKAHDVAVNDATQLQSLVFAKQHFTPERAQSWLKRNKKTAGEMRETSGSLRFRQESPHGFEPGSFRTINIAPGVEGVIGHPKVKNDGHDVVDRTAVHGLRIAIENKAGTIRRWHDEDGNETGSVSMKHHYGFLEDHLGADGEELDCYVGPKGDDAKEVHLVHQLRGPGYARLDEQKAMIGFGSPDEAKAAYLAHRNDGERAYGGMTSIPVDIFKDKLTKRTGTGAIRA